MQWFVGLLKWIWRSVTFRFRSEDARIAIWAEECAHAMPFGSVTAKRDAGNLSVTHADLACWSLECRPNWQRRDRRLFSYAGVDVELGDELSIAEITQQVIATELNVMYAGHAEDHRSAVLAIGRRAIERFFNEGDAVNR